MEKGGGRGGKVMEEERRVVIERKAGGGAGVSFGEQAGEADGLVLGPARRRAGDECPRRGNAIANMEVSKLLPPAKQPKRMVVGGKDAVTEAGAHLEDSLPAVCDHVLDTARPQLAV